MSHELIAAATDVAADNTTHGARREQSEKSVFGPLLELDAATFCAKFNRWPFVVEHRLAAHPLFALPRLVELARRLPESNVKYTAGNVAIGQGLYKGPRNGLSVEETIRQIEECGSWMVLKFVEADDEYRALLDACLDEVAVLSEPLDPGMRQRAGFIFISSPGSVTPYHIDPEYNFLLQIRGRKAIHILNGEDRSVISEQELERNYAWHDTFHLPFADEYRDKAECFEIAPGQGLHFPVTAPHWVENGPEVSISFSITFQTPASERRDMVYSVNGHLRRWGIKPVPYGRSPWRDGAKFNALRVLRRAGSLVGKRHSGARRHGDT